MDSETFLDDTGLVTDTLDDDYETTAACRKTASSTVS